MGYARDVVSDCCGAEPIGVCEDLGLCPECKDHCTYVEVDDEPECEVCNGSGQLAIGHPSDPDCDYRPCDYCQPEDDPDKYRDDR